jgi:hypothetical protein
MHWNGNDVIFLFCGSTRGSVRVYLPACIYPKHQLPLRSWVLISLTSEWFASSDCYRALKLQLAAVILPSTKKQRTTTSNDLHSTMPMPRKNRKLPQNGTPASFVCPLTTQLMEDPVMDLCAHNFERAAITEWLNSKATHECCPISRKPLTVDDLVPNHTLAERIDKWQWHQENDGIMFLEETKMSESYSDDDDDDDDDDNSVDIEEAEGGIIRKGGTLTAVRTDSDVEMVAGRDKRQSRAGGNNNKNNKYGPVPVEFMLLPQERKVLHLVRMRAQEHREKRRRSALCNAFMGVSVVVFLVFLALAIRKVLTAE